MIKTFQSKRNTLFIAVMFVVVAIIAMTTVFKQSAVKLPQAAASVLAITSVAAADVEWPRTLQASGPVTAWQEAIIGSEISGQRLVEVLANVGDNVKKGQVLARYNTDMLLAEKAELEANWIQADADRKRAELLKKSGAMSIQLVETYVNKAAVAKARLDAKNLELRYASVRAPDDGVISARTATLGAIGNPGIELFRMILRNQYEWRGELTAQQVATTKLGQSVKLTLPDGTIAHATIRQVSPAYNSQSRMATVYADIAAGSQAHAGMYADGVIEMESGKVVSIPAESVVIRDGYSYVFKLDDKASQLKVLQQRVTAGRHQGNQVEILNGLKSGERIADKGAGFLNDGDIVRLSPAVEIKS